ncbi:MULTISPECIES: mechanosensitive ion channel domain-containing protein [Microbacterium]|uniref:mechanosensitive ion channel domain-containing protein n=1 Tax=Microbacterium TaxID=33882 RepID=UPI002864163D|nr:MULTISPECIES: mechanosensitive ion channel domain-containing protein [Microbacterium]MDR7112869.1 small-conductance mechanosensitive channel [Microbacterium trichothecenolyticum]MDT0141512.1 mechanosensitive ion channel [Microbacterium sp. PRC9]
MADIVSQPWFWPAVVVSVGLPLALIGLTEFHNALARRGSRAAPIVLMVRNYLVPVAGILVLLSQPGAWEGSGTWPKVVWTIFGLLVIVVTINAVNHLVFHRAEKGSWRDRFPTIFSDLIRFVFIILGIAAVFWWVWDADVAGVFAALGITSIVVGLALQNAVGSIVSGLFLVFEAPFELGDWIETGGTRGQIVEVNWRAVHLETGNGTVIIPTAELAGGSFVNLSRNPEPYAATLEVEFGTDDPPGRVRELLVAVARDIPLLSPDLEPSAVTLGGSRYEVSIPLRTPGDRADALDAFATRVWYAARRGDLHLDGDLTDDWRTSARLQDALRQIAPSLSLAPGEAEALAAHARLERYCAGESLLRPGIVPVETRFILAGTVVLGIPTEDEGFVQVGILAEGDAVGLTALSRTPTISRALATSEVDVVVVPVAALDDIVRAHPVVAREIVRESENRLRQAGAALAAVGETLPRGRFVVG